MRPLQRIPGFCFRPWAAPMGTSPETAMAQVVAIDQLIAVGDYRRHPPEMVPQHDTQQGLVGLS